MLWYSFDDSGTTGTTVTNLGGLGSWNNGTLNGTSTSSMIVTRTKIDGTTSAVLALAKASSQYMSIGSFFFGGSSFTICFWFKRDILATGAGGDNYPRIVDFGIGTVALQNMVLAINTASGSSNGFIQFNVGETGWGTTSYLTTSTVCDNTWRHIALVCTYSSQASSTYTPYVNGAAGTPFTNSVPSANIRTTNYIGGRNDNSVTYQSCFVDDFRLYNSALSSTSISSIYSATK